MSSTLPYNKKKIGGIDNGIIMYLNERSIAFLSHYLVRQFVQDSCMANADKTFQSNKSKYMPVLHKKNMSRRLALTDKREWYSPRDIEEIYGLSRKSLEWIRKDAASKNIPLKVSEMTFRNGSKTERKRPFVRISRKSLEIYFEAHLTH